MAKLPNSSAAVIADKKLTGYLLSFTHEEGAPKAKFYESFGFSRRDPGGLRRALLEHAKQGALVGSRQTPYGSTYEVNGRLTSPDGRNPWVLVVWMIDTGTDWPRLITAIPSEDMT